MKIHVTILKKALCGVVWHRKNYRGKSTDYPHCRITRTAVLPAPLTFCVKNQQITRTAVLPASLTFCVKINRLPALPYYPHLSRFVSKSTDYPWKIRSLPYVNHVSIWYFVEGVFVVFKFLASSNKKQPNTDDLVDENKKFDINQFFDMAENTLPISGVVSNCLVLRLPYNMSSIYLSRKWVGGSMDGKVCKGWVRDLAERSQASIRDGKMDWWGYWWMDVNKSLLYLFNLVRKSDHQSILTVVPRRRKKSKWQF